MKEDDFINLDSSCDNSETDKENGGQGLGLGLRENNSPTSTPQLKEDLPNRESVKNSEGSFEAEENQHEQDMDLEDDIIEKQPIIQESVQFVATVTSTSNSLLIDDRRILFYIPLFVSCIASQISTSLEGELSGTTSTGIKRARVTSIDKQPSVRVIYSSLARESKRKLTELMQVWSEWQAQYQSSTKDSTMEPLESGEETYFPALHLVSEKSSTVVCLYRSFWLDNQAREGVVKGNDSVPLYDREYALASTSLDGSASFERVEKEDSRCFNCGSYGHSVKECPKPRDNAAISKARRQHNAKRNQSASNRGQTRYYQKTTGKFDDLKAGVLGPETRECLGIRENDPPPWLSRMRELGYPPGYLAVVENEDQPSGIKIYADGEEEKEEYEEGELPEKGEPISPETIMTVEFPGINAPIPENADQWLWAARSQSHHRISESHRRRSGNQHDEGLLGAEPGRRNAPSLPSYSSSWDRWRPGEHHREEGLPGAEIGHSSSAYSPRYSPYEQNPSSRTSSLGRSLSEKGWRSPGACDNISPPVQSPRSPYPHPSARQSPQHNSLILDDWKHESSYSTSRDGSSHQPRDRQDQRRNRRR
ncbi:uncharacterized protein LOC109710502 isoform X3 [Ananas comosus]|uniref:Uncharacterized protein LOC109710502 isoform X3 n=1 Tax=Ananas comosus TaxID=4615 RepID=A0A6P5F666_ANACO|nr:uncharacterized protein LOC109710502 isoform X3 [Ananas comosus]